MRSFRSLAASLLLTSALTPGVAAACEADEMMTTESGFIVKVVAGSDKIKAYTDASGSEEAFDLELMQPYFVICEEGDYFRVTDLPADTVEEAEAGQTGFVKAAQVHPWTTREALSFSEIAFMEDRTEIVAWENEAIMRKYMETGDKVSNPPAFKEDLEASRLRERSTRPYPVLGSDMSKFRRGERRFYNVLLPAALNPTAMIETDLRAEDVEVLQETLTSATFLVVFDATGSMEDFALATGKAISDALETLPKEVRESSSMGFVFYRDAEDEENLVSVPPMPLEDAARALEKAASLMSGGGDVAEPVLDAVYYGANLYDWGQSGRRIIFAVLNGDAKPETTGGLDPRIPAGQDVISISRTLFEKNIPVFTVQASADEGPNLRRVLQTMGSESGGHFIQYGAGLKPRDIAGKVEIALKDSAIEVAEKGEVALEELAFDLNGYATLPLEVLDGEMLERLRNAGIDFNIDPGEGGVLVREGYILENVDLLEPQIQIEKDTLVGLVNLYSLLATAGVADEEDMLEAIAEAISTIAGEDYDPEDTIAEIIRKKLGIQFRSKLLEFDIEYLPAMVPAERLEFAKRLEDAATELSQYLEANQEDFDTKVAVWMPVAILP